MKNNNAVLEPTLKNTSTLTKIEMIPISQLIISPTNPRKTFNPEKITSIGNDIKQNGLMHPITVRKIGKNKYEIVVGSRRFRGFTYLAESDSIYNAIPAFVRELTDDQVIEMQFSENLQRDDVEPLEEASSFKFYIENRGFSVQELADRLNHNVNYIYRRLCLNNLSEKCKTIYEKGNMSLGIANLVARLPLKEQDNLLKTIAFTHTQKGLHVYKTEEQVRSEISSLTLFLKDAPFDTADPTLNGGSCLTCSKNTGCNKLLFPEITDESKCTDKECFKIKGTQYKDVQFKQYTAQYNGSGIFICDTWASKDELAKKHKKINPESFINYQSLENFEIFPEAQPDTKPAYFLEADRWSSPYKGMVNRVIHIKEIPKDTTEVLAIEEEVEEDTPNEKALAEYETIERQKIEYLKKKMCEIPLDFNNTGWLRFLFNSIKSNSKFDSIRYYKDNFLNTDKSYKSKKKELEWAVEFESGEYPEFKTEAEYIAAEYEAIRITAENYNPKNCTATYAVKEIIQQYVLDNLDREALIFWLDKAVKSNIDHWYNQSIILACASELNIIESEGNPTLP